MGIDSHIKYLVVCLILVCSVSNASPFTKQIRGLGATGTESSRWCTSVACPLIRAPWPGIPAAKLLLGIWDGRETDGKADLRLRFTDLQLVWKASCPGQAAV